MTSQWQVEMDESDEHAQASRGFPARIAAAIAIAAALLLVDRSTQMAPESSRIEQDRPSACGADAVARAQREVTPRIPTPSGLS